MSEHLGPLPNLSATGIQKAGIQKPATEAK
jgi:hypothetical protein